MDAKAKHRAVQKHRELTREHDSMTSGGTDFGRSASQIPWNPRYDSDEMAALPATRKETVEYHRWTAESWAGRLRPEQYLEREDYLHQGRLAAPDKHTTWVLTNRNREPDHRPMFSFAETYEKKAWVAYKGTVSTILADAITSMFNQPQFSERQYPERLMRELHKILREKNDLKETDESPEKYKGKGGTENDFAFSVIWSDIDQDYHEDLGWTPLPSWYHSLDATASDEHERANVMLGGPPVQELTRFRINEVMCSEKALQEHRNTLAARSKADDAAQVTFVPTIDQMEWHWRREDYVTRQLLNPHHGEGDCGSLISGVLDEDTGVALSWARFYTKTEGDDTLNILRVQYNELESDEARRQDIVHGIAKCLLRVQVKASQQSVNAVQVWNADPMVEDAIKLLDPKAQRRVREKEHVACLRWDGSRLGFGRKCEWCWREYISWR